MNGQDLKWWIALVLLLVGLPASAFADDAPYLQVETGASFLPQWSVGEWRPGTASYGATLGYRWDWVELGVLAQHSYWLAEAINSTTEFPNSVLNFALEGALTSFDDRVRHALAVGSSTLLFETDAAPAGHTGLYLEATPVGLRLPLGESWLLNFEPFSAALMAPVLDGIPLYNLSYRTTLGVEYAF